MWSQKSCGKSSNKPTLLPFRDAFYHPSMVSHWGWFIAGFTILQSELCHIYIYVLKKCQNQQDPCTKNQHFISTAKTDNSAPSRSRTFPWQLRPMSGGSISGEFPMKNLLVIPSKVWSLPLRPWSLLDVFAPLQYMANYMATVFLNSSTAWRKCHV